MSVRPSSSPLGVLQTVALALRLQNVAAVREPVQRCSREPFAAEDFGPVLEGQVRRHDEAVAFVSRGDDVEEELSSSLARGERLRSPHRPSGASRPPAAAPNDQRARATQTGDQATDTGRNALPERGLAPATCRCRTLRNQGPSGFCVGRCGARAFSLMESAWLPAAPTPLGKGTYGNVRPTARPLEGSGSGTGMALNPQRSQKDRYQ